MRKSYDSLSILVAEHLERDPFSGHLFAFCNRNHTIIKILYWDHNGFCLWNKRLEKGKFRWPSDVGEVKEINSRQLRWLLEGLEIRQSKAHDKLNYSRIY